jgi:hypothetical protein
MVIAEARGCDEATVEDRNRVRASWLAAVAAGAGVSTLSNTASAARFGFKTKLGGLVAAGAVVGAGAVGALAIWPPGPDAPTNAPGRAVAGVAASQTAEVSERSEPARDAVVQRVAEAQLAATQLAEAQLAEAQLAETQLAMPQVVVPESQVPEIAEPQVAVPLAIAAEVVPSDAVGPARRARAVAPSPVAAPDAELSGGQLGDEIALITTARRALTEGDSGQALAVLAEHGQRFAEPLLKSEARALTVDALCASGDREAARRVAEAFLDAWPASPLSERVRNACR